MITSVFSPFSLCIGFFQRRRRHPILQGDWSSDVCSSDPAVHRRPTVHRSPSAAPRSCPGGQDPPVIATPPPPPSAPVRDRATRCWTVLGPGGAGDVEVDRKRVVWGQSGDLGGRGTV